MMTREELDKVRDLRKFYLYPHDWHQGIDDNAGRRCGYEAGFDAAVSLLWPAIEACIKIESHQPENIDKVTLIQNVDGYRECARKALSELKERVK